MGLVIRLPKMKLVMNEFKNSVLFLLVLLTLASCKDDEVQPPAASATFLVKIENVLPATSYFASGTTNFLMPGESQTISFNAGKGMYLSFATMFVQSNDLFYAFDETGLALYDDTGVAKTGDVTSFVDLWDAGTEVNEEPGVGPNQAPRQTAANTGADENGVVQLVNDGYTYPTDESVIKVSLAHDGGTMFTLMVENISGASTLPSPLAPGVWAIHGTGVQLFTNGQSASVGLERIAEDGDNSTSSAELAAASGYTSPFAPGVWAVHEQGMKAIFTSGAADRGEGLEALAEDGDPSALNTALTEAAGILSNGVFNTPDGAGGAGPLLPGGSYSFTFDATEGDYLSLATMLVHTNDLFYAFTDGGWPLFNNGVANEGNATADIFLWDAGTEVNEYPGAGNNQPARGGGNSGPAENGNVRVVDDGFTYPSISNSIKVTIQIMN